MKKARSTKPAAKTRTGAKRKVKRVAKSKNLESPIHNTTGGEMPNPASRNRPERRDVRYGFR